MIRHKHIAIAVPFAVRCCLSMECFLPTVYLVERGGWVVVPVYSRSGNKLFKKAQRRVVSVSLSTWKPHPSLLLAPASSQFYSKVFVYHWPGGKLVKTYSDIFSIQLKSTRGPIGHSVRYVGSRGSKCLGQAIAGIGSLLLASWARSREYRAALYQKYLFLIRSWIPEYFTLLSLFATGNIL